MYNDNERFISILSDYGFKATFGNETDTRFLRKALQALINSPVAIQEVTFIQNKIKGVTRDSRRGIYDLFCKDERGDEFIVEMQLSEYPEFIQRVKFYLFYRLNTLIRKGDYEFDDLPKIYCIGILAVNIFPNVADYQNIAVLKNQNNELIDDQMTAAADRVYNSRIRQVYKGLSGYWKRLGQTDLYDENDT
ncbi:Rpn family recombination-promoting nuclease/putative transposase [Fibrella aquatilis]|uniref:Rpn family recombination-promoting nuclease/putative transposase n=1 Tax=Fibrella aquatilis TaxID=2817059 RepID=UPI001E33EA95|nr:Rpn family recombination-promoting nuclease/putative transposase [Fibrella aquatilis]